MTIVHHHVHRKGRGLMTGLELSRPELRVLRKALVAFWSDPNIRTERERKIAVRLWQDLYAEFGK